MKVEVCGHLSLWPVQGWINFLAKGGGQTKKFQYCLNPSSSEHFLYFRAIQRHPKGTLLDPTLQDNVVLTDDVAEHIFHVGTAHDMHSIIQRGLIPRRISQDGQAVSVLQSREPDVHRSESGRRTIQPG